MYSIVIPILSIIYFLENFDILMCVDHYLIYESYNFPVAMSN